MTRNLKALGLALVAVFAMAAVFASGAQALKVTVNPSPAILTGENILHGATGSSAQTFTLTGGQVLTCEEVKVAATVKNGEEKITAAPTYKKCHAKIGTELFVATVTMNDCDYEFYGGKKVSSTTFSEVKVDLVCPTGKKVEIHVYKPAGTENEELCTYFVAPFVGNAGNEAHNEGSGETNDVTLTTTAEKIAVTKTGSLLCGGASETATYTGTTTIKAFEDLGGSISEGTEKEIVDGAQGSLTISE